MTHPSDTSDRPALQGSERDILLTLFDLGRKVASVIDIDELLPRIPELLGRLMPFDAFAIYLVNAQGTEVTRSYAIGYSDESVGQRLPADSGLLGRVVASQEPVVTGDVSTEADYVTAVPGMRSTLTVPLIHQARSIGAMNMLSRERDRYAERDVPVVRQFAAHVATALANARLFARQRQDAQAFEALAEIGKEMASELDLEVLLSRIVHLGRRLVNYRTFGILLLNEATERLEMKAGDQYDPNVELPAMKLGEGLVGIAAEKREVILVPDVSQDPAYVRVVGDVRSELVVPMIARDRCIGVFDVESPELDAFSARDVQILTMLASQAAVAIDNARLYEAISANEARLEREVHFAKRVQAALLPTQLPKRVRGIDLAGSFSSARELGGDFHDFLLPDSQSVVVALGDVSGKGVPAALYSVFASELVRSRTLRRRARPEGVSPANVLVSINSILHERQLEEYYCTLCYVLFDLKRRVVLLANSGVPYPIRASGETVEAIELPGVPLGSFFGVSYDEVRLPFATGDRFVF